MKGKSLFLFAVLMLTSMLAYISCRKIDTVSIEKPQTVTVEKFLTLPASASPEVKRIAERLRELNKRANFLNEIAKKDGFPVWDEVVVSKPSTNRRQTSARSSNATDTIIYIPLVLPDSNHVSAFIYARLNDSINLQLHRADNYADYGFGTLQDTVKNAEKLALQFMLLDNKTFGHTDFKILDNRLFKDNTLPPGTLTKDKKLHITHTSSQEARFEFWEYDVCASESYWDCPVSGVCCRNAGVAPGACSACDGCWKTRVACKRTTIAVYVDDGPPQGGGGGPTNDGGGGGPSGGDPTGPTQCNPTPELDNGLPPCPRPGGSGWMPELQPLEEALADFDARIKDSLTHQCLQDVLDSIKSIKEGKIAEIIYQFSGEVPNWNLTFKEDTLSGNLAQTDPFPTAGNINIIVDSNKIMRGTNLAIARTLMHEAVHAYLVAYFINDTASFRKDYQQLFRDYIDQKSTSLAQHEEMGRNFVAHIAFALKQFGQKMGYNVSDVIYHDLAWGGLYNNTTGVPAFNALTPFDRERIRNRNAAENNNIVWYGEFPAGVKTCN